jgi:oligopeptide transport system substrate-binding protein
MRRFILFFMRRRLALLALALLPLLQSCSRPPHVPGTLRLTTDGDASTLDPALSYDTTSIAFVRVIYRGLVDYDDNAHIINAIAKSRTVSADGKTYTFVLRPDARFHSGRRVEAEDFRFAIERVLTPATQSDGLSLFQTIKGAKAFSDDRAKERKLQHCAGIEVRGTDTIIFTLERPDLTFLNYLALPFGYAVNRQHVADLEKNGESLSEHPDGDGPFRFVSWTHDVGLKLEKNPDYYDKSLPKCERIEVEMGNSSPLQMMRFERGDNDILSLTAAFPPDFARFKRDPKWQARMQRAPMTDVRYMILNTELKPFDNKLVRQAVNCAVNKERILAFRAGRAVVAKGVLPPNLPGYHPNLRSYEYNPQKARRLLKEAGFKDDPRNPPVLWYAVRSDPWYPAAASSIQQDLKAVGISIALKAVTYPELKVAAGTRKNCHLAIIGWIGDFPDPSNFLDVLLNGEKITDTASNNRAFYNNPKVNALLDAALVETNASKRLKRYGEAEQMVMDDAPWVPLNHSERFVVTQPHVTGYRLHPAWNEVYETVAVNE